MTRLEPITQNQEILVLVLMGTLMQDKLNVSLAVLLVKPVLDQATNV